MNPEQNKAIARRYFDEVFNRGNLEVADEVLDPTYFQRSLQFGGSPRHMAGPASIKRQAARLRANYPDFHYEIEKMVAEGDTVMVCGMVMGTYQGRFGDIPPGGRPLAYASVHMLRFSNGRIVEDWNLWDSLGWWQQLDVLPDTEEICSMAVRNPGP